MNRDIQYIVIHCTATPQTATVESIKRHWRETLGWKSPGYHRLIDKDGKVYELSHFNYPTNGVKGFNSKSIHISYIGGVDDKNKPLDNRTDLQKASILNCIFEAVKYAGKKVIIQGHKDFPNVNKACPSFEAKNEYSWINA